VVIYTAVGTMSLKTAFLNFLYSKSYYKAYEITYKSFDCINHMKYIATSNKKNVENVDLNNLYSSKYLDNRIIFPCHIPEGEFKETTVEFMSKPDLKVAVMKTPYGFYVQPREPFYKYQFEEFFGFGCGNLGFDEKKTIFIPFN
jgi:hypothetical protein